MALTLGNWILLGILFVFGTGLAVYCFCIPEPTWGISSLIVTIVLLLIIAFGLNWYHTNTADGARVMKDYQSNMSNGIERYLAIVADDGMIVYEREGKFDIEIHDNYIVFDENHQRTILYRSYTTTLIIEETGR